MISVLLPIKNATETLQETLISIVTQEYSNFEVICVVASSNDNSLEISKKWAETDSRIKVVDFHEAGGVAAQCNLGLSLAKGKYVAICNADDINLPNRFLAQSLFLENNPEVGVVGSDVLTFGRATKYWRFPNGFEEIKATMLFRSAIANPTAMIRRSVLTENNITYDIKFHSAAEDLDLWQRLSEVTTLRNLNLPLVRYRIWNGQVTQNSSETIDSNSSRIRLRQLEKLGVDKWDENIELHELISRNMTIVNKSEIKIWFNRIRELNSSSKVFQSEVLQLVLEREYFKIVSENVRARSKDEYRFGWISSLLKRIPIGTKIRIAKIMGM